MLICGVDPGLTRTGYGVIEAHAGVLMACEGGTINPDAHEPLEHRLRQLHEDMFAILREFMPEVVAVEDLYTKYEHPRTAVLMGHARGVIYLAAGQLGIPVVGYTATTVKKALTGSGRASKAQVQAMVQQMLGLDAPPTSNDVSDALALAVCHANARRYAQDFVAVHLSRGRG